MRDTISIPRVALLHPKIRSIVKQKIEEAEARLPYTAVRVVQGLRTFAEQEGLYAIGRTVKGAGVSKKSPMGSRVTNAKAGQSFHNYGQAFDFALLYDKDHNGTFEFLSWDTLKDLDRDGQADWMEVVEIFEKAGFVWGGRFTTIRDNPHLEEDFGYTWRQLLLKYLAKEFITGTKYLKL